jgi:hypothetical protein
MATLQFAADSKKTDMIVEAHDLLIVEAHDLLLPCTFYFKVPCILEENN